MKKTAARFQVISDSRFTDDIQADHARKMSDLFDKLPAQGLEPTIIRKTYPLSFTECNQLRTSILVYKPKGKKWNDIYGAVNRTIGAVPYDLI